MELLMVMGILSLMLGLAVPALTSLRSAADVTKAAYDLSGVLEQARAYSMANNTFVYVGIVEVNAAVDPAASRQDHAGFGRVAVAVVASRTGSRGYDITNSNLPLPAWTNYNNGSQLTPVGGLQVFENIHLAALPTDLPVTPGMTRPPVPSNYDQIGNVVCSSVTPFEWPLGTARGTGQYSFDKVINFDPQGSARIQYADKTDEIRPYLEIAMLKSNGNVPVSTGNAAAIQIDGMTGATRIYRP